MSELGQVDQIVVWMRDYARRDHPEWRVCGERAVQKGDWLYLPATVEARDAYEETSRLQQFEDAWNNEVPPRQRRLMPVPTGD